MKCSRIFQLFLVGFVFLFLAAPVQATQGVTDDEVLFGTHTALKISGKVVFSGEPRKLAVSLESRTGALIEITGSLTAGEVRSNRSGSASGRFVRPE